MQMKYIMKEKGLVDDSAKVIKCPYCGAASLYQGGKIELPLFHDERCTFVQSCRQMKINPHDLEDERVMRILELSDLFAKEGDTP